MTGSRVSVVGLSGEVDANLVHDRCLGLTALLGILAALPSVLPELAVWFTRARTREGEMPSERRMSTATPCPSRTSPRSRCSVSTCFWSMRRASSTASSSTRLLRGVSVTRTVGRLSPRPTRRSTASRDSLGPRPQLGEH